MPFRRLSPVSGQPWRWRCERSQSENDLTTSLLLARGCAQDALDAHRRPTIRDFLPDPSIFRDMEVAATRLADAVERRERVTIFGDYDVDGATSAALMVRLLRDLGLIPAAYIPDRLMEGYGPSAAALTAIAKGGADLIVTVDCGAQAFDALSAAADAGVDVIVVDHHQCAAQLPRALAVVNPNRLDEDEGAAAFGHLAAVGVAFVLGAALLRTLRARGFFADRAAPSLMALLDLVALGTVADVAALRGLNRAFVTQGLKVMGQGANPGLVALRRAARLTRAPGCSDLGFALGPRINAGGRVGRADLGVRLLTTDDPAEAEAIAAELDALNDERRAIEGAVQEEAATQAAAQVAAGAQVIVASGGGWHPGVIGIVAGRLKERFGRPAFVIAVDDEGVGKGSGRSVAGVDLGNAVLAAKDSGLLVAGGGHAMAAGLTVAADAIGAFREFLEARLAPALAAAAGARALLVDTVVAPGGVTPALVEELEAGGPYGMGWPAPRVATGPLAVIRADVVGAGGHVRAILAGDDGRRVKAVAFRSVDLPLGQALLGAPRDRRLWVAGRVKRDDWGAQPTAEMHLDDLAFAS